MEVPYNYKAERKEVKGYVKRAHSNIVQSQGSHCCSYPSYPWAVAMQEGGTIWTHQHSKKFELLPLPQLHDLVHT